MNKIQSILVLFLVCCVFGLKAQEELKKEYAVYFESNSYELNKAAQTVLEKSLAVYDNEQMTIRLQAFTDDVGSQAFNEKLANQRALAVQKYLLANRITANQIELLKSEELKLNENEDKASQRRKNRRVVIQFWGEIPEKGSSSETSKKPNATLVDFFEQEQKRAQQFFRFDASLGTVIEGKRGTILQIPPDALVRTDGKEIEGMVKFTLQEAYSYGDMLLQNLNTTAQGKQLETGGMFFMKAVDASGTELKVKKGAQLQASLPTKEAKLGGMQAFEGAEDANGNIDWSATNRFVNNIGYSFGKYAQTCQNYKVQELENALKEVAFVPDLGGRLPRQQAKPKFSLRKPQSPRLKVLKKKSSKEELEKQYPQRKQESSLGYYRRIITKRSQLARVYRKGQYANNNKIRAFNSDSLKYVRTKKSYDNQLLKYNNYDAEMKEKLKDLQSHMTSFSIDEYNKNSQKIGTILRDRSKRYRIMKSILVQLEQDLTKLEDEGCEINDLLAEYEAITLKSEQFYKLNTAKHFQKILYSNFSSAYKGYQKGYKGKWTWDKATKKVNRLMEKVAEDKKLMPYQLNRIVESFHALKKCYNFGTLARKGKVFNSYYANNKKSIDEFIEVEAKIKQLLDKFLIRKKELGILSSNELAQMYGNVMNISAMGWINCDRFIEEDAPRMNLDILTEYNPNTRFYILFEDIRSVISPYYREGRGYVATSLPSTRNVKVIGITIVGQEAEIFMQSGTVAQLDEIKPIFETKSLGEVRNMMDVQQ